MEYILLSENDEQRLELDAELRAPLTEPVLGWVRKPHGWCRGDACIPAARVRDAETEWSVDVVAFAELTGKLAAVDREERVIAFADAAPLLAVDRAPDFTLDGRSLGDFRGRKVALVFWASWCGPCMAMVPQERALVKRLEGKPFALVGVNGDEDRPKAKAAMDKEQMTWPSFFDGKVGRGPVAVKWGVSSWPTVIVLDARGVIRHVDPDRSKLDELIDALLAEMDAGKK